MLKVESSSETRTVWEKRVQRQAQAFRREMSEAKPETPKGSGFRVWVAGKMEMEGFKASETSRPEIIN